MKPSGGFGKKKTKHREGFDDDEQMREVEVRTFSGRAVADDVLYEKYSNDELEKFERYYGAHPKLLEGFAFVRNSERKPFLADVTERKNDITPK